MATSPARRINITKGIACQTLAMTSDQIAHPGSPNQSIATQPRPVKSANDVVQGPYSGSMIIRKLIPAAEVEIMIGTRRCYDGPAPLDAVARQGEQEPEGELREEGDDDNAGVRPDRLPKDWILERFDVVLKADEAHRAAR